MDFADAEALQTGCTDDIERERAMIDELYLIDRNEALFELIHLTYEGFVKYYKKI